jgi:hypothetical protein
MGRACGEDGTVEEYKHNLDEETSLEIEEMGR